MRSVPPKTHGVETGQDARTRLIASVGRVLLFGFIQVPAMLVIALTFALLLDSRTARFQALLPTHLLRPGTPSQ